MRLYDAINDCMAGSAVCSYFKIKERGSTFMTELAAGIVIFLASSCFVAVNPALIADAGGNCSYHDCTGPMAGAPDCIFYNDHGYMACQMDVRHSLVSATVAVSLCGTFLMAMFANLPLTLAPGMGVNAFFAISMVGHLGTGPLTYQQALAACLIEGGMFLLISLSGLHSKIVQAVPSCIKVATAGGVGLFLAVLGLQHAQGLGLLTYDSAHLVTLGGCPPSSRAFQYTLFNTSSSNSTISTALAAPLGHASASYACTDKLMQDPTLWLGIAGAALAVLLMAKGVRGAIKVGVFTVAGLSWIPGTPVSYLGAGSPIPGGQERLDYFKHVLLPPNVSKTALALQWDGFGNAQLWIAVLVLLYLNLLDASGTLAAMSSMLDKRIPSFINERTHRFPGQLPALLANGVCICMGALLGIAPPIMYIESAAGVQLGGRTGLAALVASAGFAVMLFITPIAASVPPYAVGVCLLLVGAFMVAAVADIDWADVRQAVPAFVTILVMPFTNSVANGLIAGLASYLLLYLALLLIDLLWALGTCGDLCQVLSYHRPAVFGGHTKPQTWLPDTTASVPASSHAGSSCGDVVVICNSSGETIKRKGSATSASSKGHSSARNVVERGSSTVAMMPQQAGAQPASVTDGRLGAAQADEGGGMEYVPYVLKSSGPHLVVSSAVHTNSGDAPGVPDRG